METHPINIPSNSDARSAFFFEPVTMYVHVDLHDYASDPCGYAIALMQHSSVTVPFFIASLQHRVSKLQSNASSGHQLGEERTGSAANTFIVMPDVLRVVSLNMLLTYRGRNSANPNALSLQL